jgi:hypothetical protein
MMAHLRKDFQWRDKVETFPWARVQPMDDGVQLTLRVARSVPLGKYWRSNLFVVSLVPCCHGL